MLNFLICYINDFFHTIFSLAPMTTQIEISFVTSARGDFISEYIMVGPSKWKHSMW